MPLSFSGPTRHPWQTPLVLCCALVVVGAGLWNLSRQARPTPDGPPPDEQRYRPASPAASVQNPFPGLDPSGEALDTERLDPYVESDAAVPEAAADLAGIAPAVYDVFRWLAARSDADLARDAIGRSEWHYNRLLREPGRWRWRLCHVYGLASRVEPETFSLGSGLDRLWRVTLYDETLDRYYTVLTPLVPEGVTTPKSGERAARLAGDGLFAMVYPFRAEGGWERTPLFFARRLYRTREGATPRERLDERLPWENPLPQTPARTAEVLDQAFLADHLYAPAYSQARRRMPYLADPLEMAHDLSGDQPAIVHAFAYLSARPTEELARAVSPGMNYAAIMEPDEMPVWMRGQAVVLRGRAVAVRTVRRTAPDALGFDRFHVLTVRCGTLPGGAPEDWSVAAPELPEGLRFDDRVEATGILLKRYPFPARDGERTIWRWSPLAAACGVRRLPPPEASTALYCGLALLALAACVALALAVRRGNREVDDLRRKLKNRRAIKNQAEG